MADDDVGHAAFGGTVGLEVDGMRLLPVGIQRDVAVDGGAEIKLLGARRIRIPAAEKHAVHDVAVAGICGQAAGSNGLGRGGIGAVAVQVEAHGVRTGGQGDGTVLHVVVNHFAEVKQRKLGRIGIPVRLEQRDKLLVGQSGEKLNIWFGKFHKLRNIQLQKLILRAVRADAEDDVEENALTGHAAASAEHKQT